MAIRQLADGRWAVYYKREGKLRWEYFGRGPAAEADARARHTALGIRTPAGSPSGPLFGDLAASYYQNHQFASPRAAWQHKLRMTSRLLPFFGHRSAIHITDKDLEDYIRVRRAARFRGRKQNTAFATIRRELVDLKAIFAFATRRRPPLIPFNPVRDFTLPREDNEVILPPTAEELSRLLAVAPEHLRRILRLNYYTGLRPGPVECYSLRWDNVNWQANTLRIVSAKKGGPVTRHVPIHPDFLPELKSWHTHDKAAGVPWLVSWCGKQIAHIHTVWRHALKKAGITRRLRPYDMRHLFITQACEAGANYKDLAEITGSRPETLMRFYQHVSRHQHRATVALIPTIPAEYSQPNKPE